MELRVSNLEKCFNKAKECNAKYIGIKVWMFGFEKPEIIINPIENFDSKLNYYKAAYSDDLTLKNAPGKVKIIGFTFGDSFEDIEKDLVAQLTINVCI